MPSLRACFPLIGQRKRRVAAGDIAASHVVLQILRQHDREDLLDPIREMEGNELADLTTPHGGFKPINVSRSDGPAMAL